jgi:hypothetical protein
MNVAWILSGLLAVGAAAWVIAPLFRSDARSAETFAREVSERSELLSRKEQLLVALRDLDDDRETGKMNERDHAELESRLTAETAEVLRRLDEIESAEREKTVRDHPAAVPRP